MQDPGIQTGFGKQLANSEKKVRDRAVRGLLKWLKENDDVTELQLRKLWKGLFYAYWMSDKPLIQQHLANRLASLVLQLPPKVAIGYLDGFWKTICSEWWGIDRLRLDKFYLLLRKFHFYAFQYLEQSQWDANVTDQYLDILGQGPLKPNDMKIPDGLRYHTSEVFVDELRKALDGKTVSAEQITNLLKPFFIILGKSASDIVVDRVIENVFDTILAQSEEDAFFDMVEIGKAVFELATSSETINKNRSKIVGLYKKFASRVEIDVDESQLDPKKTGKQTKVNGSHIIGNKRKADETDVPDSKRKKKALQETIVPASPEVEVEASEEAESLKEPSKIRKQPKRNASVKKHVDPGADSAHLENEEPKASNMSGEASAVTTPEKKQKNKKKSVGAASTPTVSLGIDRA
ncbi:nucleolar protein,Nop52-domain-containing protein [Gaertneriomyces semiglobifer]|nr:nucleolar protein,Nop52-domain-containing protein [Gaertneriomyces semiglobifer]